MAKNKRKQTERRTWYVVIGASALLALLIVAKAALAAFGNDLGHAISRWFGM
jgi:hypothetical protein